MPKSESESEFTPESPNPNATFYAYLHPDVCVRVRVAGEPRALLTPDTVWGQREISEHLTPIAPESARQLSGEILAGRPVKWFLHDGTVIFLAPALHPAIAAILKFFSYAHLPKHLQERSEPFAKLADELAFGPQNDETAAALRKLLEAKDCAVRAWL